MTSIRKLEDMAYGLGAHAQPKSPEIIPEDCGRMIALIFARAADAQGRGFFPGNDSLSALFRGKVAQAPAMLQKALCFRYSLSGSDLEHYAAMKAGAHAAGLIQFAYPRDILTSSPVAAAYMLASYESEYPEASAWMTRVLSGVQRKIHP